MKTETTILRWARGLTDRQLFDQAQWQQRNIAYNRRRLWACRFDGERACWYHEIVHALCIQHRNLRLYKQVMKDRGLSL